MLFLPYRAKNPPESVPYVTIGLIALNILVYLAGADYSYYGLVTREGVIRDLAISDQTFSVWRIFTSMFLHADIFHIGGNMLFLWIFGASVEGRLRSGKFAALYFICGIAGALMNEAFAGIFNSSQYSLGASGAIMGLAAAYLWMFPHSKICIYFSWLWFFRYQILEWSARWVIAVYIGGDLLSALVFKGNDGIGHFAHIGGFGAGLLICFLLKVHRDDEQVSQVQALRSDAKDVRLLALHEIERLLDRPTDNVELVEAYIEKAMVEPGSYGDKKALAMMQRYQGMLIERGNAELLALILLRIPRDHGSMPSIFYLRLGSKLEGKNSYESACRVYRQVYDLNQQSPDSEVALYRIGRIMESVYQDRNQARVAYSEMLRLFPNGSMAEQGRRAMQGMQFHLAPAPGRKAVTEPAPPKSAARSDGEAP